MRFIDPTATKRLDLGACQCPGTPHESDWVEYRSQLGYGALGVIAMVASTQDLMAARRKELELAITEWNLAGPDGAVKVDADAIYRLDPLTAETIVTAIDEAVQASQTLPNTSGARSQDGSPASARRTPSKNRKSTRS